VKKIQKISFIVCTSILLTHFFLQTIDIHEKERTDLIIFSFDRPMQLYALLESIEMYISGIGDIRIIYRASNMAYQKSYDTLQATFPKVMFIQQTSPPNDFKPLTMQSIYKSPHAYIMFAVDDMIVTDFVDLTHAVKALKKTNAYGFFLRLGKNIQYSYVWNRPIKLPNLYKIDNDTLAWDFNSGHFYWSYPNTVDMTIYNKDMIKKTFECLSFTTPNSLEFYWNKKAKHVLHKKGLCYKTSKVINIPINLVQKEQRNRNLLSFSTTQLLEKFNKNFKINITPFFKINNNSSHMAYDITFTKR